MKPILILLFSVVPMAAHAWSASCKVTVAEVRVSLVENQTAQQKTLGKYTDGMESYYKNRLILLAQIEKRAKELKIEDELEETDPKIQFFGSLNINEGSITYYRTVATDFTQKFDQHTISKDFVVPTKLISRKEMKVRATAKVDSYGRNISFGIWDGEKYAEKVNNSFGTNEPSYYQNIFSRLDFGLNDDSSITVESECSAPYPTYDFKKEWETNPEKAFERSKVENKPILMFIAFSRNDEMSALERASIRMPEFLKAVNDRAVLLYVDMAPTDVTDEEGNYLPSYKVMREFVARYQKNEMVPQLYLLPPGGGTVVKQKFDLYPVFEAKKEGSSILPRAKILKKIDDALK